MTNKDEFDAPSDGVESEIVQLSGSKLPTDVHVSGVRIRPKPRYHYDGGLVAPTRDPAWSNIVRDFQELNRQGGGDLITFAMNHAQLGEVGPWLEQLEKHLKQKAPGRKRHDGQ